MPSSYYRWILERERFERLWIVTEDPGGLLLHQYVDWLPTLNEAGLAVFTRPIVELSTVYSETELRETPELSAAMDELAELRNEFGLPG